MSAREKKHTPTPWGRVVKGGPGVLDPKMQRENGQPHRVPQGSAFILAADNETVIARFPKLAEAERAFRAVNAHDDLVKALEAAPRPGGHDPVVYMDWFFKVRQAALSRSAT